MYGDKTFWLAIFAVMVHQIQSEIKCSILENRSYQSLKLSLAAANGIVYPPGMNKDKMKVFDCKCEQYDQGEIFEDYLVADWDDTFRNSDNDIVWTQASVINMHGCLDLKVDLRSGRDNIADLFGGGMLIIQDIEKLDIDVFDEVGYGYKDGDSFRAFTSIYFRNVTMTRVPSSELRFEDMSEILMSNIKLDQDVNLPVLFKIDNKNSTLNPVFRLEESTFAGIDIGEGRFDDKILEVEIFNDQRKLKSDGETEECFNDFKGKTIIKNNKFGHLGLRSFSINGGERFEFENNMVDTIDAKALQIENQKNVLVRRNTIMIPREVDQKSIQMVFDKEAGNNCDEGEWSLPESAVGVINVSGNRIRRGEAGMVDVLFTSDYDTAKMKSKIQVEENEFDVECDCNALPKVDSSLSADEKINEEIRINMIKNSKCLAKDVLVMGKREDICNGKLPETKAELEEKIRSEALMEAEDDVKSEYNVYIAIAAIVSFVVAAVLTFIIVKFACKGDGGGNAY